MHGQQNIKKKVPNVTLFSSVAQRPNLGVSPFIPGNMASVKVE